LLQAEPVAARPAAKLGGFRLQDDCRRRKAWFARRDNRFQGELEDVGW
jgi:hypothetical protein